MFHAIYVERGGSAPVPVPPAPPEATARASASSRRPRRRRRRIRRGRARRTPQVETSAGRSRSRTGPSPLAPPGSAEALAPLQPLIEALQSGDSIIIFPEGTRGHTGEPQKFKSGLFTLAQMFPEVVLVPAWIDNVQRVMPKGEVVPVPILCSVTFGAPISSKRARSAAPFLDRAREAVVALRDV